MQKFLLALACSFVAVFALNPALATDPPSAEYKPLVVLVFDQTCKAWCSQVRPVIKELQTEYGDRVTFAELDATDSVLAETKKQAKELGLLSWMTDVRDYVPLVAFFDNKRKVVNELLGPKTKKDYKENIEKALSRTK